MKPRSSRPDVRNPMLKHPVIIEGWRQLPPDSKAALILFLKSVSKVAHAEGDALWNNRKYYSAQYWKVKAVDARHLAHSARHADGLGTGLQQADLPIPGLNKAQGKQA